MRGYKHFSINNKESSAVAFAEASGSHNRLTPVPSAGQYSLLPGGPGDRDF